MNREFAWRDADGKATRTVASNGRKKETFAFFPLQTFSICRTIAVQGLFEDFPGGPRSVERP